MKKHCIPFSATGWTLSIVVFTTVVGQQTNAGATPFFVDGSYTGVVEDGSENYPYKKIQDAIGAAATGDTVQIKPGVYEENVFIDKELILSGTSPDTTIIRGAGGTTLTIGANLNVAIEKLTITKSNGSGILLQNCITSVNIVLRNIVSVANAGDGFNQSSDDCLGHVLGYNCIFANNGGDGIEGNSRTSFMNSIFFSNGGYGTRGTYFDLNCDNIIIVYCNIYGNAAGHSRCTSSSATTNLNPLFVDASTGDFRLQSTSPCRNAGSPDQDARNPDGSRNDMGAYGGPVSAGFYDGYGNGPVVTNLHVSPGSVPANNAITITATGKAQ